MYPIHQTKRSTSFSHSLIILLVALVSLNSHVAYTDALTLPSSSVTTNHVVDSPLSSSTTIAPTTPSSQVPSNLLPMETPQATSPIQGWYNSYRSALDTSPLATKMATGAVIAVLGDAVAQAAAAATSRRQQQQTNGGVVESNEPKELLQFGWFDAKRAISFAAFYSVFRALQHWLYPPMFQMFRGQYLTALCRFACAGISMVPVVQQSLFLSSSSAAASSASARTLMSMGGGATAATNIGSSFAAIEQALVSQLVIIPLVYYPLFYTVTSFVQGLSLRETIDRVKTTFIPVMKRNLLFWVPLQYAAFRFVCEPMQIPVLTALGLVWTVILSLFAGSAKKSSASTKTAASATTAIARPAQAAQLQLAQDGKEDSTSPYYAVAGSSKMNPAKTPGFMPSFFHKKRPFSTIPLWFKK